MAERVNNKFYNDIGILPSASAIDGDGLIYIGDNPLLIKSPNASGQSKWFLNPAVVKGGVVPELDEIQTPENAKPGVGLRRPVYPIETMRSLATTPLKSGTTVLQKNTPNRHEQYSNMLILAEIKNQMGRQVTRNGDIIFAVDESSPASW